MERRAGKTICFGVCPNGHALLWVGEERVRLTPEQLRTLIRLGTETLASMGLEAANGFGGRGLPPLQVSTELH